MPKKNKEYAKREIILSRKSLESNPDDIKQKDRLAYWSAYLGDFKTAEEFATSSKTKSIIEEIKK